MKKLLKNMCAALSVLSLLFALPGCASGHSEESSTEETAETDESQASDATDETSEEFQSGDFTYVTDGSGNAVLTKYNGTANDITIPDRIDGHKVTAIGESCFAGQLSAETVTIPAGVTEIRDYAFEACSKLKEVSIPDTVTKIGKGAFSDCSQLESAAIPAGVSEIGDGAFFWCRMLTEAYIPSSVSVMGDFIFSGCSHIEKAVIGDGVKRISDRTFFECQSLTDITIPDSVEEIGKRAFAKCTGLENAVLPDSLEKIGDYAFAECEALAHVQFPEGLEEIGASAFSGCFALEVEALSCKKIGERAFRSCLSVKGLKDVRTIEKEAFQNCDMGELTLPSSAEGLKEGAFKGARITAFSLEKGCTRYQVKDGMLLSEDGKTLIAVPSESAGKDIVIPSGVEEIADYAVAEVYEIASVSIPEGVKKIGRGAFKECLGSTAAVTFPSTVTEIGEELFTDSDFKEIDLSETAIEEIPEKAFYSCLGLKSLTLPETVKKIGHLAFGLCENLEEFVIPAGVAKLSSTAFYRSTKDISAPGGNFEVKDYMLLSGDGKVLYSFLFGEDEIDDEGNTAVEAPVTCTVPDGVETISEAAFIAGYGLKEICLPDSVSSVGEYGIGYICRSFDGAEVSPELADGLVIYTESPEVHEYARTHDISCFIKEAAISAEDAELAGGETMDLELIGALDEDVIFTSQNAGIASVSEDGTVTGIAKGETYITAAVGHCYYKCHVTVTSDAPEGTGEAVFDESPYHQVKRGESAEWVEAYRKANEGNIDRGEENNAATQAYKSQNYYRAMNAALSDEGSKASEEKHGDDYKASMLMLDHAENTELSRYEQTEDIVLFSGLSDISDMTGAGSSLAEARAAVGSTFTVNHYISTAICEGVATHFGDYVYIIYADKELINGGYIEDTVGGMGGDAGEYELLFAPGATFEVIDAGVRYTTVEPLSMEEEPEETFERYIKLKLVSGSSAE